MDRPTGWENPYLYFGSPHSEFDVISNDKYKAYEAGADAMLEGLLKTGVPKEVYADCLLYATERGMTRTRFEEGEVTYMGKKGKLVFIPED